MRSIAGSAQTARNARAPARSAPSGSAAPSFSAPCAICCRLGLDLLEDRLEQLLLAAELVVERAARDAGGAHDLLGPDARVATRGEQLARGVDELGARGGRALVLLVGGLAFHTACM